MKEQSKSQEKSGENINDLIFAIGQADPGWLIERTMEILRVHLKEGTGLRELPMTIDLGKISDGKAKLLFGNGLSVDVDFSGKTFEYAAERIIRQIKRQLPGDFPPQKEQEVLNDQEKVGGDEAS